MSPTQRRTILRLLVGMMVAPALGGCHHRRARPPVQVNTGQGVHVRAPFVDIHVPTRGEPRLDADSRDDHDDDDD